MDVVYILKLDEFNTDLAYSLRSLYANATNYTNVWGAGYTPKWVSNLVTHIPRVQNYNKWRNALDNLILACKTPEVSEDFILFNDDFFAINKVNLATDLKLARGTLDETIEKYEPVEDKKLSTWRKSFIEIKELLTKLGSKHFMNFALHVPMIINKKNFLSLMELPEVQEHLAMYGSLSYRNLYGNMFYTEPRIVKDCKLKRNNDVTDEQLEGQWISVFDHVTNRLAEFPKLASVLKSFKQSPYEKRSIL